MRTAPDQAAAIEASLEIAAARLGDLTPAVYARLFQRHPDVRSLFARDGDDQVKGEMLARAFEAILDFVGERRYAHLMIQCEVVTHAGYDVPPEVFAAFFPIVAETAREACAADWTPGMDAAWRRMLADLDDYVRHPGQDAV